MGTAFFIGPFDPVLWKEGNPDPAPVTDLRINPENYSQKLFERWPYAKVSNESRFGRSWTLDEPKVTGIDVLLHADLLYVSFDAGKNFTDFILWHRQMVPSEYLLYLFSDASWDSLKLYMDTTRHEIQAFTKIYDL